MSASCARRIELPVEIRTHDQLLLNENIALEPRLAQQRLKTYARHHFRDVGRSVVLVVVSGGEPGPGFKILLQRSMVVCNKDWKELLDHLNQKTRDREIGD
jgi:hypothetical protein